MAKKRLIIEHTEAAGFQIRSGKQLTLFSSGKPQSEGLWIRPGDQIDIEVRSGGGTGVSLWIFPRRGTSVPAVLSTSGVSSQGKPGGQRIDIQARTKKKTVTVRRALPAKQTRFSYQLVACEKGQVAMEPREPMQEGVAGTMNTTRGYT